MFRFSGPAGTSAAMWYSLSWCLAFGPGKNTVAVVGCRILFRVRCKAQIRPVFSGLAGDERLDYRGASLDLCPESLTSGRFPLSGCEYSVITVKFKNPRISIHIKAGSQ